MSIPGLSIANLEKNYPTTTDKTAVVTDTLGAGHWLLGDANLNTCAIRMSHAFNYGGAPIKAMAGVHAEKGTDGLRYLIRANDMYKYCEKQYGAPDVTKKGSNAAALQAGIVSKPGVLFFRLRKQRSGQVIQLSDVGHADIWNGARVWYNDEFEEAWEIALWTVR